MLRYFCNGMWSTNTTTVCELIFNFLIFRLKDGTALELRCIRDGRLIRSKPLTWHRGPNFSLLYYLAVYTTGKGLPGGVVFGALCSSPVGGTGCGGSLGSRRSVSVGSDN